LASDEMIKNFKSKKSIQLDIFREGIFEWLSRSFIIC